MQERKRLGYIMFRVNGGIVNSSDVDLFTDPNEAKDCAKLIIEDCYERDRYANPEHPDYDDQYAEQSREEYEERFEDAENLRNVGLNTDDDLIFLKMCDYGVTRESLEKLPERARKVLGGNFSADPAPLSDKDILSIFQNSYS